MDIRQILKELARVQLQVYAITEALKQPLRIMSDERELCPKCRRPHVCHIVRLMVPTYNVSEMIACAAPDKIIVGVQCTFQILDAWCDGCGYDWQAVLRRLEPDGQYDDVIGVRPQFKFNAQCHECFELAVRGFFRNGRCVGGICVNCGDVTAPPMAKLQYTESVSRLRYMLTELHHFAKALQLMAENSDDPPSDNDEEDPL